MRHQFQLTPHLTCNIYTEVHSLAKFTHITHSTHSTIAIQSLRMMAFPRSNVFSFSFPLFPSPPPLSPLSFQFCFELTCHSLQTGFAFIDCALFSFFLRSPHIIVSYTWINLFAFYFPVIHGNRDQTVHNTILWKHYCEWSNFFYVGSKIN